MPDDVQIAPSAAQHSRVGVVVIGRNEGDRLRRCLDSMADVPQLVYVDSGSSDDSVSMSRARGIAVVELDLQQPFTAARARNAGFRRLLELYRTSEYVFFVDGDCEVAGDWLCRSREFLDRHPDVAVVWGRRRERYPERSIYNMLCDMEWDSLPAGESKACGGDAMVRVDAFTQVGGYRTDLICGEEPEMCIRLRQHGWRIWHLGEAMTLHDAAMYRFRQWWKRSVRTGYAFALGAALHGAPPERHWVRESRRAWLWGLWIPGVILLLAVACGWQFITLAAVYPLQTVRVALRGTRSTRQNWIQAAAFSVGKFPEMLGQLKYILDRGTRAQPRLIEYK